MIDDFLKKYTPSSKIENSSEDYGLYSSLPNPFVELISKEGGTIFENGIFRIHTFESSLHWALLLERYFADNKRNVYPFAFDWMGRHFCINDKNNIIYMFDSAMFEVFTLDRSIDAFFNEDLVEDADDLLNATLFMNACQSLQIKELKFDRCIGYKVPLYLGGKDEISNWEILDMEVYWDFMHQIYIQVKDLPDGTKIDKINLK